MILINLTTNLKLGKPASNEKYNIQVQNTNMDILDESIRKLKDSSTAFATKEYVDSGLSDTNRYIDLSIVNKEDKINGMSLSSNDYTNTEKNKLSGIESGAQRNVINGIKGDAESSYRTGSINITKANIGLSNTENKSSEQIRNELTKANVVSALGYIPEIEGAYENATAYTDTKFKELTGLSSESMETINKLSETVSNNQSLIDILNNSITIKADQAELDTHTGNNTIHITSTERTDWNAARLHADSNHARIDATKVESSAVNGKIKINGTETIVYTHPSGTNPHGTTKSDIGLSNVPNVTTNDQTPTYTMASSISNLTSGEKLSVAFSKIAKAISLFINHMTNETIHRNPSWTIENLNVKSSGSGTSLDIKNTNLTKYRDHIVRVGIPTGGYTITTCNISVAHCQAGFCYRDKTGNGFSGSVWHDGSYIHFSLNEVTGWTAGSIYLIDHWYR